MKEAEAGSARGRVGCRSDKSLQAGVTTRRDPFNRAGVLLAPLAAVPAAALHFAAWHRELATAAGALHAALVILPLSYSLTLFIGVPYLFGLRRLGVLNVASMAAGGVCLGLGTGYAIGVALFPLWDWYARFFYLSLGGLCGLSVALAYWLVRLLSPRR